MIARPEIEKGGYSFSGPTIIPKAGTLSRSFYMGLNGKKTDYCRALFRVSGLEVGLKKKSAIAIWLKANFLIGI